MAFRRSAASLSKRVYAGVGLRLGPTTLLLLMLLADPSMAQTVIAYPARGQSPEEQERDRYDCFNWAVEQTGFNPEEQSFGSTAPPPLGGGALPGAFGGAALGAAGGAIGDNAGEGAAIGAAAGGLFGGFRRREMEMQQAQMQQQEATAHTQRMAEFNRADAACLRARGYSVD